MPDNRVQNQQIDQRRLDDNRQASRTAFDREIGRIRDSMKNDQSLTRSIKDNPLPQVSNILDSSADKFNIEILSKLISSLSTSNIELNAQNMASKVASSAGEELDLLFTTAFDGVDSTLTMDRVVSDSSSKGEVQNQQKKETEKSGKDPSSSGETVSVVKDYSAAYASLIVNAAPDLKKKLDKLEDELKDKGLKDSQIGSIKDGVKRSIRDDLAKSIKEAFIQQMLVKSKSVDDISASKRLHESLRSSVKNESVFGGAVDGLAGAQSGLLEEAQSEAKDFVLDELESKLLEKILGEQKKGLENELKSLTMLAVKLGVDMEKFLDNWREKKVHLGLYQMDPRLAAHLGFGDKNEERETRYEIEEDEEKEILINRLRALFMRRALMGDIITRIDTAFKMRALKNGLIKLGLRIDDFEHLAKEGVEVARRKLLDMLTEALSERATLYDLAGPAFKLIEKKIKGIMSNLERIGEALTVSEFENMRDSANRKMFDVAGQELAAVDAMLKTRPNGPLEKKRGQLLKLIARLKEESGIEGVNISFGMDEDRRGSFENIRESA